MKITADGNYDLNEISNRAYASVIYVGSLNGATCTLTHRDIPLTDGALAENTQVQVNHGRGARVQVTVTGFGGEFELDVHGVFTS